MSRARWRLGGLVLLQLCWAVSGARAEGGAPGYRFGAGVAHALALAQTSGQIGFAFPAPAGHWDTALLAVEVQAEGEEPHVALCAGALRVVQYLDPGARGVRWLNLTSLGPALSAANRVTLEAHGLRLVDTRATLWLFDNALPPSPRVLVLAPHPDDAEIAAFGFYARHAARTTIVTVTAGNGGSANYQASFGDDVAGQYLFKGTLRALDSVTVPWLGGVPPARALNLGYFDERLEAMYAAPGAAVPELYRDNRDTSVYRRLNLSRLVSRAPRENRWANLVDDLVRLLQTLRPELVIAPHPLLDSHADHAFTSVALSQALARVSARAPVLLLYTNHAGDDLYPYGPAGSVMSLPPPGASEVTVPRVFAFPVEPLLQRQKRFALEAMHDLRPAPELGAEGPRTLSDYLRRAPRSEELFYVYDRPGLRALVHAFLAARAVPTRTP